MLVYAFGKPGFFMYEQFWEIVDPQVVTMKTQHTPNLIQKSIYIIFIFINVFKLNTIYWLNCFLKDMLGIDMLTLRHNLPTLHLLSCCTLEQSSTCRCDMQLLQSSSQLCLLHCNWFIENAEISKYVNMVCISFLNTWY